LLVLEDDLVDALAVVAKAGHERGRMRSRIRSLAA
jgi:hypothetical protein